MKTKQPKEDPRLKSLREAAERRADADYTENTGALLDDETRQRIRKFGARGGAGATAAARAAAAAGTASTGSGGSGDPATYSGGSAGSGRGSGGSSGRAVMF
jgi:hypothetical protein